MKIATVQIDSYAGDLIRNIEKHLAFAARAVDAGAEFVLYPELSLTGYEPRLARRLATTIMDERFAPLRTFATKKNVILAVGLPIRTTAQPHIGMGIFRPRATPTVYSKMLLDPDELPYFSAGHTGVTIRCAAQRIAPAICYESQQEEHLQQALLLLPTVYAASVALPDRSVAKSLRHYADMAEKHKIAIVMANCIGQHDVYRCGGHSAIWDEHGALAAELDGEREGGIVYDLKTKEVEMF